MNEREHGAQSWATFERASGAHAGCCGLRPADPAAGLWELGFHLRPEFWGRGDATEAARAVVAYAFGPFGARAPVAGHHPDNGASRGVLLELGFRSMHAELDPPTGAEHPSYRLTQKDATR